MKKGEKILFSICVPVYNVEKYLHDCIESVLNQSYGKYELVLVDDGSTDDSYQICKDYQSKDARVKAFTKENGGQISAREFAFEQTCGDVILCVDADDFIEIDSLKILSEYFDKYDCDCIYFNYQRVRDGKVINKICDISVLEYVNERKIFLKKICLNSNFNSMCTKAFKRKFIPTEKMSEFFKIRYGEDLIQTLFVLKKMGNVLFIPEVLYNYRINQLSVSNSWSIARYEVGQRVRFYVYKYLKNEASFSQEDWLSYGSYAANLFYQDIFRISLFRDSFKKKLDILKKERESLYYEIFLKNCKANEFYKNICLSLFGMNLFMGCVFFCKILYSICFLKRVMNDLKKKWK